MSKRKKIFHKPDEQVPSADDILNYLNDDLSPVPPMPKKSSPGAGAQEMRKKMEKEDSSLSDLSMDKLNSEEEVLLPEPTLFRESASKSKKIAGESESKNKKKYDLEKSMLSEPLVSDAVEGFALLNDRKKAQSILEEINKNISSQTRKKNNSAAIRRVAAVLIILFLVSGSSLYLFDMWSEDKMAAVSNEKINVPSNAPIDSVSLVNKDKKTHDQLAIEANTNPIQGETNNLPITKPVFSDGYLRQEENATYPESEDVLDRNGAETRSMNLPSADQEKKEVGPIAPQKNGPGGILYDSIHTSGDLKDQIAVGNTMAEDDYSADKNSYSKEDLSKSKKREASVVSKEEVRRSKQKGSITNAPASKSQSELVLDEEKSSGVNAKVYLLEEGIRLYNQEKYAEAKEVLLGVLVTQPSNQEAIFYSGMSDYKTKLYESSLANLSRIIPASRRFDESRWYRALIYIELGRKEEAVNLWKELSKTNNSYSDKAFEKLKEYSK